MKKILTISALLIIAALVFGIAGYAYAQTQTPGSGFQSFGPGMINRGDRPAGFGPGMMAQGGTGRYGWGMMGRWSENGTYGPMHAEMVNAFADAIGITPDELQAQLEAGETMWTIAQANGLSADAFTSLMEGARLQAIQASVAAGSITQQQADWMIQRMSQMQGYGYGPGSCPMNAGAPRSAPPAALP